MLQTLRNKLESKRAVWSVETQKRIVEYAEQEQLTALNRIEKEERHLRFLNEEVSKYLKTVLPTFLLKPEVNKALLNMLHARSEGTVSININMTKEMRKAYSFYHNDLNVFIKLLERKGYIMSGNEEVFLTTFLTKLRENNYWKCLNHYGDFLPENLNSLEAFEIYFEVVEEELKYDSGNVDFFATYLNHKGITDFHWTKSNLKRKLKQFEKANKDEFKLKQLEKRMNSIIN